jgi:tRNA A-37 threonylcarbamoyl transferase component Bud32
LPDNCGDANLLGLRLQDRKEGKKMSQEVDLGSEVEQVLHFRPDSVRIHEKLDDFFSINRGDIVLLGGAHYVVSGTAKEKSFGLDDEPKYWVKYAYEASTGKRKIIKLVYLEQFDLKYGEYLVRCFRSPAKEGRVLESVKGLEHFMQGRTVLVDATNHIRLIDYIAGKTLFEIMVDSPKSHEQYFHESLPALLQLFLPALKALGFLHSQGIRHGDVRSDHLILDKEMGKLRWIDFDYDFIFNEAPFALDLLGVADILSELIGKGERCFQAGNLDKEVAQRVESLKRADFSVVQPSRLMNWRKLYSYVPEKLNRVLMSFAAGAEVYYESVDEILEDIGDATALIG